MAGKIVTRPQIDKNQAIMLLRKGLTTKEIVASYSGFRLMQLAGFQAHLTMGTYLTKAKAISLLKAGQTPAEIAAHHAGFTKMQLAGFQAHITMGTY